ncbi:gliding motility-associated lipoprotein GldK [Arcticibacter tournemirensis]|uniref:SUMF1/EgtB/PvdO family nonheme iron enzyme n=1 Tax=Arcticibacter tournemirensis TaxID=699437 RepID=A0A5M9H8V8_9SPHI|nr:SUMF1/EgtB/PvdO family nonheme iron enzyme [Arcticibacter tournemirensis]KAA8483362.1 SUMF1/EgtB/PvdO family nonheme iron enzyme [Arcticibacter tournemirensis]TQM50948.1 gliding motility-associated lipoprotein GldK [Arcticibacter tournemirensis]
MLKLSVSYTIFLGFVVVLFMSAFNQKNARTSFPQYGGKNLPAPPGMAYIPSGTILYKTGTDTLSEGKNVSLSAFFIDKTEVSNKQYRQFVNWVADSIAVTNYLKDDSYFKTVKEGSGATAVTRKLIDWDKVKKSSPFDIPSVQDKLAPMFVMRGDRKMLNPEVLKYRFTYLRAGGSNNNEYVTDTVSVMPAEGIWSKDFPNAQMAMMDENYFYHSSFDNHPVVGVTWKQARAYTDWRGKEFSASLKKNSYLKDFIFTFSLPTEAQWQYAAEGKTDPEDANKNKVAANFKQGEGLYSKDGATFTLPVKSYSANAFGIYNMAGNVSEWTLDAYSPSAIEFVNDLNPVLLYDATENDGEVRRRKVVRGGSWKDPGLLLNSSTRNYENQDMPHSYIGFRCVMSAIEIPSSKIKAK